MLIRKGFLLSGCELGGFGSSPPPLQEDTIKFRIKGMSLDEKIGQLLLVKRVDFSYKIGRVIAKEPASFGYNMDFAPVLDINSNPKNTVIGDRSFGDRVKVYTTLRVKTMEEIGIRAGKVILVVKHFPGMEIPRLLPKPNFPGVGKALKNYRCLNSFRLRRRWRIKRMRFGFLFSPPSLGGEARTFNRSPCHIASQRVLVLFQSNSIFDCSIVRYKF